MTDQQLVNFLSKLTTAEACLTIKSIHIANNPANNSFLASTIQIAHLKVNANAY